MSREVAILPPNNFPVNYLGRLSDGRTDVFSQTDLFVQHELKLGGGRRLQFQANVLNLFNQEAAISKYSTYQKVDGINSVTDAIVAEVTACRPGRWSSVYPVVCFDALRGKIRDERSSAAKPSTSRWPSCLMAGATSSGYGLSRPKAPNSG